MKVIQPYPDMTCFMSFAMKNNSKEKIYLIEIIKSYLNEEFKSLVEKEKYCSRKVVC